MRDVPASDARRAERGSGTAWPRRPELSEADGGVLGLAEAIPAGAGRDPLAARPTDRFVRAARGAPGRIAAPAESERPSEGRVPNAIGQRLAEPSSSSPQDCGLAAETPTVLPQGAALTHEGHSLIRSDGRHRQKMIVPLAVTVAPV